MKFKKISILTKFIVCIIIIIGIGVLVFVKHQQGIQNRKSENYYYVYTCSDIDEFKSNIKWIFRIFANQKFPLNHEELIRLMISEIQDDEYYYITEDRIREFFERYKYFYFKKDKEYIYVLEYDNEFDDIYIEEQHNMRIAWDDDFQIVPEECGEILRREKGFWKDKYYKESITKETFPDYSEPPVRIKEMVK